MARMPRGEPRSVPDPAGEQVDAMLREERRKRERAEAVATRAPLSLDSTPFEPFESLDAVRYAPRRSDTATIGGQTYREIDNGHANVLVPVDDPLVSPAELAKRRQGIEQTFFMAGNPLAGAAYGIAEMAGASPRAGDEALAAGALADAVMTGAAPLGAGNRRRIAPPERLPPQEDMLRDNIRIRDGNASGQAAGVEASIERPLLGTGTKPDRRLAPPGWQGHGTKYNEARGHLLAKQLGGAGEDPRNIVTQTQHGSNTPQMKRFEDGIARRVRAGEVIEYTATPLYTDGILPPSDILLTALGSRGAPAAKMIRNPAGRPK